MCDDGKMATIDYPVRQIRTIILVTGFTDSNTTILQVTGRSNSVDECSDIREDKIRFIDQYP